MPTSTQRFRLVGEDDASRAFLQVAAASRLLKSNMDDVSSSVMGLGKLMGGTSLIPVAAGATAAIAELTTSLGAATGAGGIFGLSVVGQVKAMAKQQKAMQVTDASLSKLTKGSSDYNAKLKELHAQQKSFNQEFGPAAKGFDAMSNSWGKFLHATAPVTNGVLGKSFQLVADVLPKLVPVSNAAGRAVGGLIDDLSKWTEGPAFAHLLHFLETSGPKDITAFGHSIGNVLSGLGGLLGNFVGPGDHAAKTLEHLTGSFDKWGHSKGVSDGTKAFLKYVSDNGPELSSTFHSLGEAAPKIASALGKLGSANLSVTSRFLNLIAGMPQGAFNVVVGGMFGIAAASRAITAVTGISAILTGIKGVMGGKGLAGKVGGGILGSAGGSAGVQKVWVVNMGEGGLGGGAPAGGSKGGMGWVGKALIGPAALAAVSIGGHDVVKKLYGQTVATIFSQVNQAVLHIPYMPTDAIKKQGQVWDKVFTGHFSQALDILKAPGPSSFNLPSVHLGNPFNNGSKGPDPKSIKAVGTAVEALTRNLGKASAGMDLVGHAAQRAFPNAAKQVQNLGSKLTSIKAGPASAAMDLVGHSASKNFATAGHAADTFRGKMADIPSTKTVKVTANISSAMAALQNIQAYQIRDKSFTVTRFTNATAADHVAHGGGGGGGAGGGAGGGMGSSRRFMGQPHVSWWDGTGAPLLSSIVRAGSKFRGTVNGSGAHVADFFAPIRGARIAGRSRLQATIQARNSFASGFQGFASSAFGASFGQDPTTGAEIAPTIGSVLTFAKGQRAQARMVKTDVRKLVRMGLSPALLKQLQASGQAGIPTLQALAGASRSQIAQYNSLNKATASDLRSAGMSAGNRIFGQQIRKEEKHNAAIEHLLKQLVDMAKHHPDKLVAELKGDHIDLLLANTRRRKGKLQSDKKP